jgi:signal transduction histidine kinase
MRVLVLALIGMLGAAAAVLVAGGRLARQETEQRDPVDRAALQEFGDALHAELTRLEDLYAHDLAELAVTLPPADRVAVQAHCGAVYGIRQCLVTPLNPDARPQSFPVVSTRGDRVPDVAPFWPGKLRPPPGVMALDLQRVAAASAVAGPPSGWLGMEQLNFAAFWLRPNTNAVVVFVVDWRDVRARANASLAAWLPVPFTRLRTLGEQVSVEDRDGVRLDGTRPVPGRSPDFVLPLRNRLGVWQVSAWDRFRTVVSYDARPLAVAGTLAAVLAVLGVVLFTHQRRALRRAEERVSFVNRVSHELGSPLTNALLNLDLATEALDTQPDYARQRLTLVTEEIQRLARLVGNVLTFSRRERGTLKLRSAPCIPDKVIADALRQFEPSLTRRGIAVETRANAGSGVRLDGDALAQIVSNLISNVEKYAATGQWLGLETRLEAGTLVVRVADHGPGIPSADRARVFEPFERVSGRVNEGASGTGLGLTIARDLAARMGGSLALVNSDTGAVFELRVPAPGAVAEVAA